MATELVSCCHSSVAYPQRSQFLGQTVFVASVRFSSQNHKLQHFGRLKLARALYADDDDGLYAPVSKGDGFSFLGGKYSDEETRANDWYGRGQTVKAYSVEEDIRKAKDPVFGLDLGAASQISDNALRWFFIEEGDKSKTTVLLLHGFPSQAYSFRNVVPVLSSEFHVIALDWIGFGFSDKPQPKYGFNYTMNEYSEALRSFVEAMDIKECILVVQGYFAPAVITFANANKEKVSRIVLINPPVVDQHVKLPSSLQSFCTFLLGEVFAQDPYKACDGLLAECGYYGVEEEDKMVYRRPYLTSGAAGFALATISRILKNELQQSVQSIRKILSSKDWKIPTSIIWGMKDKWLTSNGVQDFAKSANINMVQLPEVGHHAQEDYAEEVGAALKKLLKLKVFV